MGRSSRAVAERHHQELVEAAARLVRERDFGDVSLPEVMGAIGLKPGGFYKHFESKDALMAAAVERVFTEHSERLDRLAEENDNDPAATREAFIDFCLSTDHREDPGSGCPSSLLPGISRLDAHDAPRAAFVDGHRDFLELLHQRTRADDDDASARDRMLVELSTIVGAVLLARATAGDPLSDEILAAVHRHLNGAGRTKPTEAKAPVARKRSGP
jgi:TetR/AcrR family transcriptional repressor of nem operon